MATIDPAKSIPTTALGVGKAAPVLWSLGLSVTTSVLITTVPGSRSGSGILLARCGFPVASYTIARCDDGYLFVVEDVVVDELIEEESLAIVGFAGPDL